MLEYFVHLDSDDPPDDLLLAVADVPDDVSYERLNGAKLPPNWRETPRMETGAAISAWRGTRWS